jgi:starvation-inducible DNA-binding protein
MQSDTTIPVPAKEIASLLQPLLVDLVALALNGKQAHWHVQGRHFTQLHEQLDVVVADARRAADEVAERVVALGVPVDGRPAAVATTSHLPEFDHGFLDDDKVVRGVLDQLDGVIKQGRQVLEPLEELDPISQDIVIEILRTLEKHRWMFAAQAS